MSFDFLNCQPLLDRLSHVMHKSGAIKIFRKCKTQQERIQFCLDASIRYDETTTLKIRTEIEDLLAAFCSRTQKHQKSEENAELLKIKGSKAFMKKKDDEACKYYTDGLRFSSYVSPFTAILYANRSATHIHRQRYKECIEDIDRAIQAGYPSHSCYKLYRRKIEALLKLGRKKEAQITLLEANECDLSQVTDCYRNSLRDLEEQITLMDLEGCSNLAGTVSSPLSDLFMGSEGIEMSPALQIRVNERDGRHVRARVDIAKGSALFREHPYAAILLPEYFQNHCQRCFAPLTNPIPCDRCCDVLWCGEKCKREGEFFHKYECCNLHILTSVGIAHLALRIVITAGWTICKQVRQEMEVDPAQDSSVLFLSRDEHSRYKSVFSLLNHLEKTSEDDVFQYSLAGIILGKVLLENTNFFTPETESENGQTNWSLEVELASLLVHHIGQLVSNAHAITQIEGRSQEESSPICQISQKRIATAIYPLASLMNHSCTPTIINSFIDDVLIIYAVEDMNEGDQVFNCYGPHASRQDREERQAALFQQYYFTCTCKTCTSEEALLKEASWSGLKCPKCAGIAAVEEKSEFYRCLQCKSNEVLPPDILEKCSTSNVLYEDGEEAFKTGKFDEATQYYVKALEIGEEIYCERNEFLNNIRDSAAKSYAMKGKISESLLQLDLCLQTVEARFGKESVEVAHELLKYLDVAAMAKFSDDRSMNEEIKQRIENIFTIHYGINWKIFLKIKEL